MTSGDNVSCRIWIWPSHNDCRQVEHTTLTHHTTHIYQCSAGLLLCKQRWKAGERESRFRREQDGKSMYSSHRKPAFHLCSAPVVGCLFSRSGVMRRDKTQGDAVQKCWNASAITNSLHFRMNKSQTVRNNRGESQLFKSEHREMHCRTIFCLMLLWKLLSLRGLYAAVQHVPEKY